MADTVKFTEEELKSIKDLQENYNKQVYALGQISYQMTTLKEQKELLLKGLGDIRAKESELAKDFNSKYGQGSLDLETGTFTPQK
mgnify:CR=1 FL=1|tara:strand:- start:568 stop:822 length:255 start_codon:yes stop_codon:yes gene_type:complete